MGEYGRLGECAQVTGTLPGERLDSAVDESSGMVGRTFAAMLKIVRQGGTRMGQAFAGLTAERGDCRTDEQFKADQAADGIAGESENQRSSVGVVSHAEPKGLAWLEVHFVEDFFHTQISQRLRHEIEDACRYAAAEDQYVCIQSLCDQLS